MGRKKLILARHSITKLVRDVFVFVIWLHTSSSMFSNKKTSNLKWHGWISNIYVLTKPLN